MVWAFGLKTNYPFGMKTSETYGLPKRPSKDTNKLHKKAKQNSSELAEPRRLLTACFGLKRKQETESYETQVVDSYPDIEVCEALATQETKRKLNPFVEECEASATQETVPKGVMPPKRMHDLALPESLSLDQFVAIMSPPGAIQDPLLFKPILHPSSTSSSSDTFTHACKYPTPCIRPCGSVKGFAGRARHGFRGETLF